MQIAGFRPRGRRGLYDQFVDDWDTHIVTCSPGGGQDVWMIPRRQDRGPDTPVFPVAGTTTSAVTRQPASERQNEPRIVFLQGIGQSIAVTANQPVAVRRSIISLALRLVT